jgi:uncharacterized membrane protein
MRENIYVCVCGRSEYGPTCVGDHLDDDEDDDDDDDDADEDDDDDDESTLSKTLRNASTTQSIFAFIRSLAAFISVLIAFMSALIASILSFNASFNASILSCTATPLISSICV